MAALCYSCSLQDLFSCGMWTLSYSIWDLVPWPGIKPRPPYLGGPSHSHWRRQWHPTPVLLPGKSHGRRSLVGCSPWGLEESDTTEQLHFHFSLSCIGEGNGNPLQRSCLENPRDTGAWWAAVYGVAQSWTWLKRLSSSSSNNLSPRVAWTWAAYTLSRLLSSERKRITTTLQVVRELN